MRDPALFEFVALSLGANLTAVLVATVIGLPVGASPTTSSSCVKDASSNGAGDEEFFEHPRAPHAGAFLNGELLP